MNSLLPSPPKLLNFLEALGFLRPFVKKIQNPLVVDKKSHNLSNVSHFTMAFSISIYFPLI
jgi:hypothetical protein